MNWFVGESKLAGDVKRYMRDFTLVEVPTEPGLIPGKARLEQWRQAAPEEFVFSLVVPRRVASLETTAESQADLKRAWRAAETLRSGWWVVRSEAGVRPTTASRRSLGELFAALAEGGRRVAWEPGGLWEDAAAAEFARDSGAHLVQDVARVEPVPGRVLYSRFLARGRGARLGMGVAELVAERVEGFQEAYLVVEGTGARYLQAALAGASGQEALDGLEPEASQ